MAKEAGGGFLQVSRLKRPRNSSCKGPVVRLGVREAQVAGLGGHVW